MREISFADHNLQIDVRSEIIIDMYYRYILE